MSVLPTINSLWVGSQLSALELLTLRSFLRYGHPVKLWVYDPGIDVPEGVIKGDARTIVPEEQVFYYRNASKYGHGKGSIAGFSDIFRYKLLYEHGGYWVDMDITCLSAFDMPGEYCFRYHHSLGIVGNILKCPPQSELMRWCHDQATQRISADNRNWTLPIEILNDGVRRFGLEQHIQRLSNNDQWPIVSKLLRRPEKLPRDWKAIHWMNEEFRHLGIDKNKALPGSVYEQQLLKYGIPFQPYSAEDRRALRWKLTKLNYTLINLRARWDWLRSRFGALPDQV